MSGQQVKLDDTDYGEVAEQLGSKQVSKWGNIDAWMARFVWAFTIFLFLGSISFGLGVLSGSVSLVFLGFAGLVLAFAILIAQGALAKWRQLRQK